MQQEAHGAAVTTTATILPDLSPDPDRPPALRPLSPALSLMRVLAQKSGSLLINDPEPVRAILANPLGLFPGTT